MKLNYSPIKTAKNYGINDIDIDIFNIKNANITNNVLKKTDFNSNYKIICNNIENIEIKKHAEILNENVLNNELLLQSKNNSNFELSVNIKKSVEKLKFKFEFNEKNQSLIDIINIDIENNVNANIIFEFTSKNSIDNYQNLNLKINVCENANVNIIFYSEIGDNSSNFVSIQSEVQKNAKLTVNFVDIACKNSIFNYNSKIIGENGESNINSIYIGDNNSLIDLNYLVEIFAPHSKTNMEIMGSISDNAIKHFKGTIDFKKGCSKSVGSENEFCMMLSNQTKSKALPMILCGEEDVDGKHSSSIGKVDEKELFYIMSRGLSQSESTRLVVKAKLNKLINLIFDEELKTKILETIDRKIK